MAGAQQGQPQGARTRLDMALEPMRDIGPSHDKAYGLINIGLASGGLHVSLPGDHAALTLRAAEALHAAALVASALNDQRARSYAWGHLGKLYEEARRDDAALQLTRQALCAAQQVQAPESLYRWQWPTGRLLKALGHLDEAIGSYRRAVETLQSFRQEMVLGYGSGRVSFRQTVGPVYFGLVDLLLQRAASLQDRLQYEPYLVEAREAVELCKAVELQDYLQDDCVDTTRSKVAQLEGVTQGAVGVYPILLPDRMELLRSLPDGLQRFTVPVGVEALTQEVREFRLMLEKRTTRAYLWQGRARYWASSRHRGPGQSSRDRSRRLPLPPCLARQQPPPGRRHRHPPTPWGPWAASWDFLGGFSPRPGAGSSPSPASHVPHAGSLRGAPAPHGEA